MLLSKCLAVALLRQSVKAFADQRVYTKCTQQRFFVYGRKHDHTRKPERKAKLLTRNALTHVNISALVSAPQFPNWG